MVFPPKRVWGRRLSAGLAVALALAVGPAVARPKSLEAVDLTNFLLGPEHAQWLVGPIARIATEKERAEYLALTDDAAAAAFVEGFWERRGPNLAFPPTGPRVTFENRAEEADRVFTEGTNLGRRTDRGTIFILYGPPDKIEFGTVPKRRAEPVEVWSYSARDVGLDGKKPERRYGFRKQDGVTSFFPLGGVELPRNRPPAGRPPGTG